MYQLPTIYTPPPHNGHCILQNLQHGCAPRNGLKHHYLSLCEDNTILTPLLIISVKKLEKTKIQNNEIRAWVLYEMKGNPK